LIIDTIYRAFPQLEVEYYYGSTQDDVFNITAFIKNATNTMAVCTSGIEAFIVNTETTVKSFTSTNAYLMGFMQGILGNIFAINSIY